MLMRTPKIKLFYFSFIADVRTPCFILLLFYFYFSFIAVVQAALHCEAACGASALHGGSVDCTTSAGNSFCRTHRDGQAEITLGG